MKKTSSESASLQVKVNERKKKVFHPKITLINTFADPINQISQWLELHGKINQDAKLLHFTFKAI